MKSILQTVAAVLIFIFFVSEITDAKEIFLHFTTRQGLSHNSVTSAFEDNRGFIWVSTTDGLNRFDGKSFKQFFHSDEDTCSIPDNNTGEIVEDVRGNLLIATAKGLSLYNRSSNNFKKIDVTISSDSTAKGILSLCIDSRHHLWVSTRFEVFELDSSYRVLKKYKEELKGGDLVYGILEDKSGNIWISKSGFLNMLDSKNQVIYNTENNPAHKEIFNTQMGSFALAPNGNIWGISNQHVLLEFNIQGTLIRHHAFEPTLRVSKLFITGSNKIWLNDFEEGLVKYNPETDLCTYYFHKNSDPETLNGITVEDIIEDKNGNTWITADNGLDILPHPKCNFTIVTDVDRLFANSPGKSFLKNFLLDEDKVWFTLWGQGLCSFDMKSHRKEIYKPDKTNADNYAWDLIREKNELWTGTYHGLHALNRTTHQYTHSKENPSYPREVDSAGVIKFFRDKNSATWISLLGENGIIRYDPQTNSYTHFSQQKKDSLNFPFRHFDGIAQDASGRIWMGYKQSEGLIIYDSTRHQFHVATNHGVPVFNNQVNDLLASGNFLWIASNSGLYKMNLVNFQLEKYTRAEGLINNNVRTLAMDGTGTLWIAMDGGLSLLEPESNWFTNITNDNGFPENMIEEMYYDVTSRRMYCSNSHSFFYVATDSVEKTHFALSPYVMSLSVMGHEMNFNEDSLITLNYTDKYFSFDIGAPLFPSSEQNKYAYKLDGFDKDWVDAGHKGFAGYTDLPYGNYLFHLKASHDGIHWFEMKKPLAIKIIAPFYLKKWFTVLSVLLVLLILSSVVILYYRIKLRGIMLTQLVRNKIASDLHDDIGSTLSSLSFLSEIAKQKTGQEEVEMTNYFNQIGESSRDMIQTMNDIVWSVNPQNDTFGNLTARMRKFASSILEAKNIQLEFEAGVGFENRKMSMVQRRNLYLMYKEIINNIVKHAHCCTVKIKLEEAKGKNILTISDNGKGFDVHTSYDGNGLKNLRMRCTELRADLKIDSVIEQGTTFTVLF